ncbi:putative membrane protein [Arthrobacter sp. VKM Ac-2550]|nr:putative membrane protein [Arthrobacter sp. VKM Ac-2550]
MAAAKLPAGAVGLAALLATSAANHFARPAFYYPVVPAAITTASGPLTRDGWVQISGALEFAAAAGLLLPQTRRAAGICTAVMFAGFTAGHLSALKRAFGTEGTKQARIIHSLRLPLQVPLVVWAWRTRQA